MTTLTGKDVVRRVRFSPYRTGHGPTFSLTVWDTQRMHSPGKSLLGYRLTMREPGKRPVELFTGEDFGCAPSHCIDSDETVAALMGFLTLRPGDTDKGYFAGYSPQQLEYCDHHAEALSVEVSCRFTDL